MRRREFITLLGGAAVRSLGARAQQPQSVRRVGVLMGYAEEDRVGQARASALRKGLAALGWVDRQNVDIIFRWAADDVDRIRAAAADLVGANPDVIVANSATVLSRLMRATSKVPIVFVSIPDPVASGFVPNLARPGGNVTGFSAFETATSAKWLETLLAIAPGTSRVLIIQNADNPNRRAYLPAVEAVAAAANIKLINPELRQRADIEKALEAFAREPNGGVMVLPSPFSNLHRQTLIALAAVHRLPAVYPFANFAADGGLVTYGPDAADLWRRAASYVDRILKGERAGDLPVQQPTKFELVVNLKTAKALGLAVPPALLARADEVIE